MKTTPLSSKNNSEDNTQYLMTIIRKIVEIFKNENFSIIILCLYLIYEYTRPHLIYPILNVVPLGKLLVILAVFFALVDKKSKFPPFTAFFYMTLFSLSIIFSSLFSPYKNISIGFWLDFLNWILLVLLFTSVINTRNRLILIIFTYFICNLKMAQHGFRSWMMRGFQFRDWGVTGSPGWFQNSGEFALEMVVFLPLVFIYLKTYRNSWSQSMRLIFYLLIVMVVGSILASSSRGSFVGLVSLFLWFLMYSNKKIKMVFMLTMAVLVIYLAIPPEFKARFETAGEDSTSISRQTYWEYGREAIADNPLTGIGFRVWQDWVIDNKPEAIKHRDDGRRYVEVIHNTYYEAATELGLVGLAILLLIYVKIFFLNQASILLANQKKDYFLKATAVGLNGGLIGFLVPSCFMSVLYYPYIWVMLALSICVSNILKME